MAVEGRTHRPVVNHEACSACGICLGGCPAERVPELHLEPDSLRGQVYKKGGLTPLSFSQASDPPCRAACPLGQNVPEYVRLLAQGRADDALDCILEHNPLPGVCGHVCTRPCEAACTRNRINGPVPIRALKAFAALRGRKAPRNTASGRPLVAVVGSGPAGLTAAHDLARYGIRSVLLESHHRPGGMLAWAIPRFRLPEGVLEADVQRILALGVDLKTGVRFGSDMTLEELRTMGIRVLLLAAGTPRGLPLDIPSERSEGVQDCLDFLSRINAEDDRPPGGRVLVVGGGNAAMDAARTALRLGSEVTVIYRRKRGNMPADPAEVQEAEREGAAFRFLTAPLRVIPNENGRIQALTCIRTELGELKHGSRPGPVHVSGTEHDLAADSLIIAAGQRPDAAPLIHGLGPDLAPRIRLDMQTEETGCPGVFVAGDLVSGPGSVVEAMAGGRRAAHAIREFIEQGKSL